MKNTASNTDAKKQAGIAAAALATKGMYVGLGTGSTAAFAIAELGRRDKEESLGLICIATSFQSSILANDAGLRLINPDSINRLDISIDGADEIDPDLNLIKGGGAAHTREKIIHAMSDRFIVVADDTKLVNYLGQSYAVPVEVLADARSLVENRLLKLGAIKVQLRMATRKDGPIITDNGHLVLDASFEQFEPLKLEQSICCLPGVVECGIFASVRPKKGDCYIGSSSGLKQL